jgi:hypothetical protein
MDRRIIRLRAVRMLQSSDQMREFDEIMQELVAKSRSDGSFDPALLPDLLRTFIDATEGEEQMWGLLHFVENYADELYVPTLVQALPEMSADARKWGVRLLLRVLNNPASHSHLREFYRNMSVPDQQRLGEFLSEVARRGPSLASKAAEITG